MELITGPAQMNIENTLNVTLVSSSLGSGIGLAAYDPGTNIGGILHFLLPSSSLNKPRAKKSPFMFADTGIAAFIQALDQHGAKRSELKLVAAGGSRSFNQETPYDIAQRNCLAIKAILAEYQLAISHEDFGGNFYRTLKIHGGHIYIQIPGHGEKKI